MMLPSVEACALIRDALSMYEGPLPVSKLITDLATEDEPLDLGGMETSAVMIQTYRTMVESERGEGK